MLAITLRLCNIYANNMDANVHNARTKYSLANRLVRRYASPVVGAHRAGRRIQQLTETGSRLGSVRRQTEFAEKNKRIISGSEHTHQRAHTNAHPTRSHVESDACATENERALSRLRNDGSVTHRGEIGWKVGCQLNRARPMLSALPPIEAHHRSQ